MTQLDIALPTAWAAGFLFALARMGAFAVASPIFSRAFPPIGRFLFALAGGIFLARPVDGVVTLPSLVSAVFANVAVGLVLAFVSGLVFYLFDIAGEVLDVSSSLATAQILDPITRRETGVFARLFQMTGFAMFFAVGGDRLVMSAMARSTDALPLTGGVSFGPGLGKAVVTTVGTMMVAGLELTAPALAALLLTEVALGIASRFSPQTNVFLLGLPAKLLVTFAVMGAVLAIFPGMLHGAIDTMTRAFANLPPALGGLGE